jgi:hypothetical protein
MRRLRNTLGSLPVCDVLVDGGPLAFEWFDAMDTNDGLLVALYFVSPG